jgi:two-component system sensor histidine kinase CpxA
MRLGGNLFIRMFIAFWLVTVVVLGSWLLASNYFDAQPPHPGASRERGSAPPHRFMLRVIYNLENLEDAALAKAIDNIYRKHDINIYLINRDNKDLLARPVPKAVARLARKLRNEQRNSVTNMARDHLIAYRVFRPHEQAVSAVFVFPKKRSFILNALGDNPWLRITLAVLLSGVVCFGLSRLMTSRLKELQLASRRLANGELDTRLQVREKGGDETDELARDFNSMAEQLQERIQKQKRLLGDVSHELRSPLARLRLALALAEQKPDNANAYMLRIEKEAGRLEELIAQLLTIQGQDITMDTHIDLVSLLQNLCDDVNFEGQPTSRRFVFSSDVPQAVVESSADLLRKSFENILRNALHYMPEASEASVSLTSSDEFYEIDFRDCGPGVPEQDLENIFSEFYRVDTARTRDSGGYGLGLAIVRRAVAQHGGEVIARNCDPGLSIVVRLPLAV